MDTEVELIMADDSLLNQMSPLLEKDRLFEAPAQSAACQAKVSPLFLAAFQSGTSAYLFDKVMHSTGVEVLENHFDQATTKPFHDQLIVRNAEATVELLLSSLRSM